jgi:hypothetical protein
MLGLGGLGLGDFFRLRARAAGSTPVPNTACIFVSLFGGPSHLETYDPKPEAPVEYRGPFRAIATRVPGMHLCELLPRHARVADRFALIRSCSHELSDHFDAAQQVLTGRRPPRLRLSAGDPTNENTFPDVGSVCKRVRPTHPQGLPSYVAMPRRFRCGGPAYLGAACDPFVVGHVHSGFRVPNLNLTGGVSLARLEDRRQLLRDFDHMRRDLDGRGQLQALDRFNQEATRLLTGDASRRAFDLDREDPRVRDCYGRHEMGQSLLLARRLVEAGVSFVTCELYHHEGEVNWNWDDHATEGHIFDAMQRRLPLLDQGVAALIDDLYARGLDERVVVVVTGEFGRTPRINPFKGRPGRDHWPSAMSMLVSGGGMRMGQVIGSTTSKGEWPRDRPLRPTDVLTTLYHFLGIDPRQEFRDHGGRPLAILPEGERIRELVG